MDGHHLGVHAEAHGAVRPGAARCTADGLESREVALGAGRILCSAMGVGGERRGARGEATGLESAAIVAGAVIIEALADDLAALDDNAAVAEVEGRERGLLETEIEIVVRLHFVLRAMLKFLPGRRMGR